MIVYLNAPDTERSISALFEVRYEDNNMLLMDKNFLTLITRSFGSMHFQNYYVDRGEHLPSHYVDLPSSERSFQGMFETWKKLNNYTKSEVKGVTSRGYTYHVNVSDQCPFWWINFFIRMINNKKLKPDELTRSLRDFYAGINVSVSRNHTTQGLTFKETRDGQSAEISFVAAVDAALRTKFQA